MDNTEGFDDEQRRLVTPRRERSAAGHGRSRSRSRLSGRAGSINRSLREREQELERERKRLHDLERALWKERDAENRATRSEQHGRRFDSEQRSRRLDSEHRARRDDCAQREDYSGPSRGQPRRERIRRDRDPSTGRRSRSCSPPTFSSKDIFKIIQSFKSGAASQPLEQGGQTSNKFDCKNILPEFDPSIKNQRMDVWLNKVNECASVYGWDDKTTIHFSMQKLQGLAKIWYQSLNTILFTWTEWQEKLLKAFPCEQNYGQSLEDMLRRKSRFNEPIENYFYEKLALLNQCEITGKRAVDCIIHGLTDKTSKSSALTLRCSEPDQLLRFLLSNKECSYQPSFKNRSTEHNIALNQEQHNALNTRSNTTSSLFCYNCKERGHPYNKCTKPLLKCDNCRKIGHMTENCRARKENEPTKANSTSKTMRITYSNTNDKYIKNVIVNGVTLEAFVDFGSEVSLIGKSSVAKLGIAHDNVPSVMKGFGNSLVQSVGSVTLDLGIDGVTAIVVCKVVEDRLLEKQMLIGQTYSEQPHIVVIKDACKLQFLDIRTEIPSHCCDDDYDQPFRISMLGHSLLYGTATVRAVTESTFCGNILVHTNIVGTPNNQFVILGGIHQVIDGHVNITITPFSLPCSLLKGFVFSRANSVKVVDINVSNLPSSISADEHSGINRIDECQINLGESVCEKYKNKLLNLLQCYEHCFAFNLKDLGCTNITEMSIELTSSVPVVYRPYRLSYQEREKVRGMIDEMLEAGIIRESVSNYASPIILVRKKDGKVRMCVDYRLLNSITVKERYPMPIIEDEISRLSGQAWFITLDLMSGYYQVPIAENHKHRTAFVTPDGQYEFNRVPFGLANAPAVFQRMMNHVLGPARFNKATVYIDDVLVYGKDPDEALSRLEDVLQLLDKANLKLNLAKCNFLQNRIDYLGYEISSSGMRPGQTKTQCVSDFPQPSNVHGVRQFLGLVSYFRKFIRGFAELASPLTKLLKKDSKWEWSHDQQQAFEQLKSKLINRPVLAIYDYSAETELHTDASRIGLGAILMQRSPNTKSLQPVAYYSRQTSPEEKNFHSYELETLAVICALKKFRVFLLGKDFKVITDCSALRSTFQKRDIIPRIARWWLALQEFNCVIEYRAAAKMAHADALSRNPIADSPIPSSEPCPTILTISDEDWLLTLQLGDTELGRIRDILNSNLDPKGLEYIKDNYVIKDNKLFRCLDGDKSNIRWVVPKGARWQVCKLNHDDIGHVGFQKTFDRIKKFYWFAKMSRFIKKYVASCIECAYAKKTATTREGLLHPINKVETPFHTLHIDHLGPFVKSKRGYTHLLVTVDSFTKFVFIKAVKNTKTQGVINVLEDIFNTFRAPDRLVSDRGSCFTSHAFKRFCLERGVRHILNAVASPRSNGQVERYNKTILDALTAQNIKRDERDWDNQIGRIQWGLNNTIQKTLGRTPAEVMFGTMINSESNPTLNEITDIIRKPCDLASVRSEVKDRIDKEQEKQKLYFDKGRKPARIYKKGELVKIAKTAFQNDGKSTKLLPNYEGPFKVVHVLGNDRYKVSPIPGFEATKNRRKTTIAADRMQPWIHIASLELDNDDYDSDISDD